MELKDIIAPSFYDVHKDIKRGFAYGVLVKRRQGLYQIIFVSIEIILGMMKEKHTML